MLLRYCAFVLACWGIFWVPLGAQEGPLFRFSLKESVDYALEHNTGLKNVALAKEITRQQNRQILARGLPKLQASAGYDYNIAVRNLFLPNFISPIVYDILDEESLVDFPKGRDFGTSNAQFGTKYGASAGFELNQMVLDFNYFLGLKAMRMLEELAKKDFIQSERDLIQNVQKAYYMVLVAEKQHQLVVQHKERLQTLLEETDLRYQNGFAEKVELDRLQVRFNLLEVEQQRSQAQQNLSRQLLNIQMGLPVAHLTELSDTLQVEDFSVLLVTAAEPNPIDRIEYQRLSLTERLSALRIKREQARRWPSLHLRATAGYNSGNDGLNELVSNQWFPYSVLSFTLNVPIFEGFAKVASVQEKKTELLQVRNSKITLERNLQQEHLAAYTDLSTRVASLQAQEKNRDLARSVYEISKEKYAQGLGSNLEVLNAATTLKEVETQYYNALYEALVSKINLQKAQGTLHTN